MVGGIRWLRFHPWRTVEARDWTGLAVTVRLNACGRVVQDVASPLAAGRHPGLEKALELRLGTLPLEWKVGRPLPQTELAWRRLR